MNPKRDPHKVVRQGYDKVPEAYRSDNFECEGKGYQEIVQQFTRRLKSEAKILDLGCGCELSGPGIQRQVLETVGMEASARPIDSAIPGRSAHSR